MRKLGGLFRITRVIRWQSPIFHSRVLSSTGPWGRRKEHSQGRKRVMACGYRSPNMVVTGTSLREKLGLICRMSRHTDR